MSQLARILVGYRDDLDLTSRWWHRLVKVLFGLFTVPLFVALAFVIRQDEPTNRNNIVIIDNLKDYVERHPEMESSLPSFQALGRVGRVGQEGEVSAYYISPYRLFCSGNMKENVRGVRDFLRMAEGDYALSDDDSINVMKGAGVDSGQPQCIGKNDVDNPKREDTIVYRMSTPAIIASGVKAAAFSGAVLAVWLFVFLNFYYRGLVYIVCGPRQA